MTESYNNNIEEPFVFQDNVVVVDNTPSHTNRLRLTYIYNRHRSIEKNS